MNQAEKKLTDKLRLAEGELARHHGAFALFGLFEREETPGKLDLIVSAPSLKTNRAAIQLIADGLRNYLDESDWLLISRIVPLRPDEEFVQTMTHIFDAEYQVLNAGPIFADGIKIVRAFIITANKSPRSMPELSAVGG